MLSFVLIIAIIIVLLLSISIFPNNINKSFIFQVKLLLTIFIILIIFIGIKLTINNKQVIKDFYLNTKENIDYKFAYSQSNNINLLTPDLSNLQDEVLLDVQVISQLPELPRGCEVTSLAMLLNYSGIDIDKLTLAKEIKKEKIGISVENGKKYYGNPHHGFVGDIYSLKNFGLGVYHEPIRELAETYLPNQIRDFSNGEFNEILYHLGKKRPVWVIINTQYNHLSPNHFQTWNTKAGTIEITYKEHSVLITGYDHDYIYFNDPLTNTKNKKAPREEFKAAWIQMGKQAITVIQ